MENEHKLPKGKIITAAVFFVVLLSLAIGWFLVKDKAPAESTETETNSYTELITAEAGDIKSITVKNAEGTTTVTQKAGVVTVSPENEKLTEDTLKYYLENYTAVYATREIKDGYKKLSEYKIDENSNYFEIVLSDNSKHRFCIGAKIDGGYYCLKASDKTVWLVPSYVGTTLINPPQAQTEASENLTISIDYANIFYVSVDKGGKTVFSVKRVGDTTAIPYNFYSSYELTEPICDIAYTTEFTNFLKNISTALTPMGHVGSAAENSAKYGINVGYTLTVKDGSKTHILRFGNKSDLGVYMTYNDYPYVYLVEDTVLNAVENADPLDFATPYIDLYLVDEVDKIDIKSGKNEYTLKIDNKNKKYSLNGKSLSEDNFNKIFNGISDITAYKGVETNLTKGEAVCTLTFTLKDGATYKRSYYDCQSSMVYITKKQSGIECTVKKSSVDSVLNSVKSLAE